MKRFRNKEHRNITIKKHMWHNMENEYIIIIEIYYYRGDNMKKFSLFVLIFSLFLTSISFSYGNDITSDIKDENVKKAVKRLVELGVTIGREDGKYHEHENVTREEFASLIVKTLGFASEADEVKGVTKFNDVKDDRWSSGYINKAVEKGLLTGYKDGNFKPDNKMTYDEVSTVLVRTLGYKEELLVGEWPENYRNKANDLGITRNVNISISGLVDRGSVAVMISNTLDVKASSRDNAQEELNKTSLENLKQQQQENKNTEAKKIYSNEDKKYDNKVEKNNEEINLKEKKGSLVIFSDSNLEKAIRKSINKPNDDIYKNDVISITSLNLDEKDIERIDGLENFSNLKILRISRNKISNIDSLAKLTQLEELNLEKNKIENIDALSNLTNLKKLEIYDNEIKNINPLAKLTNLKDLDLYNNRIEDINNLSNLTNLTELNIAMNKIESLDAVSNLKNLSEADFSENNIKDISPISNLTNLTRVSFCNNQIEDIRCISNLKKLHLLYAYNNKIKDISVISDLEEMKYLQLQHNEIEDITPLKDLKNIVSLDITYNKIKNLTPLENLKYANQINAENQDVD